MDLLRLGFLALEIGTNSVKKYDEKFRNQMTGGKAIISLEEMSKHDSQKDCWISVYDYVYDVSDFIKNHPGGQEVLMEYAGRDATIPFIGSGHTKAATVILKKYLIGELPEEERLFRRPGGVKLIHLFT